MSIHNRIRRISVLQLATLLLATAICAPPAFAERRADSADQAQEQQEGEPLEKTGFHNGLTGNRISLIEESTYRKLTYVVDDEVKITFQEQPIDASRLLKHSIVKLVIVDGVVIEIVLVEESS